MKRGHVAIETNQDLLRKIRSSKSYDEELVSAIEALKERAPRSLRKGLEEWNTEDGLILFRGKVVVPKDDDIRRRICYDNHDSVAAGHPGRWKTYEMVSRNYWWPGMSSFVEKYVTGCDTCARTKNSSHLPTGPLKPNEVPTRPWEVMTCDFIMPLPKSQGYDAIFVAMDRLTKQVHVAPTTSDIDAQGTADLFIDKVWKLHGTPKKVISDQGTQFVSKFMKEVFERLGIDGATSTSFRPQTDGQTERVNQELEQYLRAFVNKRQSNWARLLPTFEFAHNQRAHASTKMTPFQALYGFTPGFVIQPGPSKNPTADTRLRDLAEAQKEAQAALEIANDWMKQAYDRYHAEAPVLSPGEDVWLDGKNVPVSGTRKLSDKWLGPYKILERIKETDDYKLALPTSMRIHPSFHVSLLRKREPDEIPGRVQPPPRPVKVRGQTEYVVESIEDTRLYYGLRQYLVKWEGYTPDNNMWEPEDNL